MAAVRLLTDAAYSPRIYTRRDQDDKVTNVSGRIQSSEVPMCISRRNSSCYTLQYTITPHRTWSQEK